MPLVTSEAHKWGVEASRYFWQVEAMHAIAYLTEKTKKTTLLVESFLIDKNLVLSFQLQNENNEISKSFLNTTTWHHKFSIYAT